MLKAKLTGKDGKPGLILGITMENVKRLKEGQPIKVDLTEMGLNADLMIFYATDEQGLIATIAPFIGKDTVIHDGAK